MRGISLMTSFMLFFVCVIISVLIILAGSKLIFMPLISSVAEYHPEYLGQQIITYVSQAQTQSDNFQVKILIPIKSTISINTKGNIIMIGLNGYVNFTSKNCYVDPSLKMKISNFSTEFPTKLNLTFRIYKNDESFFCEKNMSYDVSMWKEVDIFDLLNNCGQGYSNYIPKDWKLVLGTGDLSGNYSKKTVNNTPFKIDYIINSLSNEKCKLDELNISGLENSNSFVYDTLADGKVYASMKIETTDILKSTLNFNFTLIPNCTIIPTKIITGSKTKYLYITKTNYYGYCAIKLEYK